MGIVESSRFGETRWSLVLAAQGQDSVLADEALAVLCGRYWYPLYAFVRRKGKRPEQAEDLTQEFFARVIEKRYLDIADRERGKFRTFLLSAFKHRLANEHDKECAQKRGGGQHLLSIDQAQAEKWYGLEPADVTTPEKLYQRRWAMMMIEQTLASLEAEMRAADKLELFEALKCSLSLSDAQTSYQQLSEKLGMSVSAIKVAVHRLRKRYRNQLREHIAQTVPRPTRWMRRSHICSRSLADEM
jgi:RNA polymerase sigma factor (sigma-70 family)